MNYFCKTSLKYMALGYVLFFVSCTDKVQVDIEQKGKTLCVDAFLNNLRADQKIRLTYTDSYFSGQRPPALLGASVTVNDLTENKTYNFNSDNDGNYVYTLASTDTIVVANHVYELHVKYQNYEYKSTTACKRASKIDSLYFEFKEATSILGEETKAGNRLRLVASDIVGPESDFYWVKIFKNGKFYGRPQNIQLEFFGYTGEYDGQLFFEEKWETSGPDGSVDPCLTGDRARLEIHGISREAYDFLLLGSLMSNNGGLFSTTPINLPTNVFAKDKSYPKVVGLFSVSDVTFKEQVSP